MGLNFEVQVIAQNKLKHYISLKKEKRRNSEKGKDTGCDIDSIKRGGHSLNFPC